MCVGSAMPVATLPVTAHRDRLSDVMNWERANPYSAIYVNKGVVDI